MRYEFLWDDPLNAFLVLCFQFVPVLMPLLPGLLVAFWARRQVARVEASATGPSVESSIDGARVATAIMAAGDVHGRTIVGATGPLANFYDPSRGELRLSKAVAEGRTPEALGVAAHEAGHALQDARGYWPLKARTLLILAAKLASGVAWISLLAGLLIFTPVLCSRGSTLYTAVVLALLVLQLVERDANRRSLALLPLDGLGEVPELANDRFRRALEAARWAEIAGTLPIPRAWWSRRPTLFG